MNQGTQNLSWGKWCPWDRRLASVLLGAVVLLSVVGVLPPGTRPVAAHAEEAIYGDSLGDSWRNWSWNSSINFAHPVPYSGTHSIWWRIDSAWGGLFLHSDEGVQTTDSASLRFAVRASTLGQELSVSVYGGDNRQLAKPRSVAQFGGPLAAGEWKVYNISLSELGGAGQTITGVAIQDAGGTSQPHVEVDEITLLGMTGDTGSEPGEDGIPLYPEIRPENKWANYTRGRPTDPAAFWGHEGFRPYYEKVNGDYVGTTEQILEWAARKWGFDRLGYPDLAKAIAVAESWWRQSTSGAHGEFGILQVHPRAWPDAAPARWSTAYAADYGMAVIRSHYDGNSWLGDSTQGSIRNSVSAWECGCGYAGGNWYANLIFEYYGAKPWRRPGQPPEWF